MLPEPEDFETAKVMTLKNWVKIAPKFVGYFQREYIDGWKNNWGFAQSIPGLSRSNGNSEGFN